MWNWVDWAIIAIVLIYCLDGLRRGFTEQLLELLGFVVILMISIWTYHPIANWLKNYFTMPPQLSGPLGFVIVLIFLESIYSLALHFLYPLIPVRFRHSKLNQYLGIVTGIIRSVLLLAVVLTILVIMPVSGTSAAGGSVYKIRQDIQSSVLGNKLVNRSAQIEQLLDTVTGGDIKQTLTFLTIPPQKEQIVEPNETVNLQFKTTDVTVDKASEQKMFQLLNNERIKVGLPALVWSEDLAQVARAHSRDMFANGYFAHTDLAGNSPFDRMSKAGITFQAAGENLAYAATVDIAHNGLMNSPGHRANILEKNFKKVGIGVIDAGVYGKMFTQDFTD